MDRDKEATWRKPSVLKVQTLFKKVLIVEATAQTPLTPLVSFTMVSRKVLTSGIQERWTENKYVGRKKHAFLVELGLRRLLLSCLVSTEDMSKVWHVGSVSLTLVMDDNRRDLQAMTLSDFKSGLPELESM